MIIEKIGVGDTIEQARENARQQLNAPEYADIKFDIICAPSKKILGLFGGKKAQVRASYEKKEDKKAPKNKAKAKKVDKAPKKPVEKKVSEKKPAEKKAEKQEPKKEKIVIDPVRLENAKVACEAYVKEVTQKLLEKEVSIHAEIAEDATVFITLDSGDHDIDGVIIGHRGETLDAIQYLASLVANKGFDDYVRVTLDVANYREKRQATLTALAHRNAKNALRTGRKITLEPMNPYERHIIHTAVQDIEGVSSHSVGSNIDRRVVITPDEAFVRKDNRRAPRRGGSSRSASPAAVKDENREPKKDTNAAPLYGIVTKPTQE